MTGPATGRLSIPVSFIAFHGFSRGWPTLTERTFIPPLDLVADTGGKYGEALPMESEASRS